MYHQHQRPQSSSRLPLIPYMSALGVSARDATKCLRCQYIISTGRRAFSIPHVVITGHVPCFFHARHFTLGHGLRQSQTHDQSHVDYNDQEYDTRSFVPPDSTLRTRLSGTTASERLAGIRRVRGDSTKLDIEALGQPAKILILRDWHMKTRAYDKAKRAEELRVEKSEVEDNLSPSEILKTLDAERGIIDSDGVCQNIRRLKEEWLSKLGGTRILPTDAQYNELAKALLDGFTVPQLETYLTSTKHFDRTKSEPVQRQYSAGCILYPWVPGSTPFPAAALSRLNSTDPATVKHQAGLVPGAANEDLHLTRKQAVVATILRRAWSLRTKEELQTVGELDMQLQPLHLDLLLNHSMFDQICC